MKNILSKVLILIFWIIVTLSLLGYSTKQQKAKSVEIKFDTTIPNEVRIGKQVWATKNLNVEKFRNGDIIPEAKSEDKWKAFGDAIGASNCLMLRRNGKNDRDAWFGGGGGGGSQTAS
jgi:hypothetical protein